MRDDREARVLRCRGKSYLDLLAQRAGRLLVGAGRGRRARRRGAGRGGAARRAREAGVAVVPFGGGTSVVGGLAGEPPFTCRSTSGGSTA